MKKSLFVAALLAAFTVANCAAAAPSEGNNVPATSKADKTIADIQAEIDKLNDELKNLKMNANKPEKEHGLKFGGFVQSRYEYVKNPRLLAEDQGSFISGPSNSGRPSGKSNGRTMVALTVDNQFDGETYFHGMLAMESLAGQTAENIVEVKEAFVAKKTGPDSEVAFGEFMTSMGLGTLGGSPYMQGAKVSFGKDVKVNLYATKFGGRDAGVYQGVDINSDGIYDFYTYTPIIYQHLMIYQGDAKFNIAPDLKGSVAYFGDKSGDMYKSAALGLEYKLTPEINLTAEYGVNDSDYAKHVNGKKANAYFLKAKYNGANPFKPGSNGFWVMYKKADLGFDTMGMADPRVWTTPFNWSDPSRGGMADNIKGYEVGFETTIAPRLIFTATYNKLDWVKASMFSLATTKNQDFMTAQATYLF